MAAIQKTLDAKRIYLQYVGDALPLAQIVGAKLKKSGYVVPGYEKVDPNKSPSKNQVRYFYAEEKPEADKIAGLMNQWVTGGVESKLLSNPNNIVPQNQFEVWIVPGSTGDRAFLTGDVEDPTGLVPGARVTITSVDTGSMRVIKVYSDGQFHFFDLPPGDYVVEASKPGFTASKPSHITLEVGIIRPFTVPDTSPRFPRNSLFGICDFSFQPGVLSGNMPRPIAPRPQPRDGAHQVTK